MLVRKFQINFPEEFSSLHLLRGFKAPLAWLGCPKMLLRSKPKSVRRLPHDFPGCQTNHISNRRRNGAFFRYFSPSRVLKMPASLHQVACHPKGTFETLNWPTTSLILSAKGPNHPYRNALESLAFCISADESLRSNEPFPGPDQQIHEIAKLEPISYTRVAILATLY
jgi:hypothetical protein